MDMFIGENIRRLRREKGITQEVLAERLHVSAAAVSKRERGDSIPDIGMLLPLASYFNVSTDELLGVDSAKTREKVKIVFEERNRLSALGKEREAFALIVNAHREFPNDWQLKYLVKIEDAEAFNKRQHTDKKLIADLAGLFTSRTEHHPLPKAEVSEETLCGYRRFVEERFKTEPEALSVTRICELTSMVGMTVHRLIANGILYGTKVQGKTFCSKSTLIDYLASEDTFRNPTCEGCKELVRTFKRRKSDDTYNEQRRERRKLEREKKGSGT